MTQGNNVRHKLQFLVNDHVIPYNMTVYQAIRQFSMNNAGKSLQFQFKFFFFVCLFFFVFFLFYFFQFFNFSFFNFQFFFCFFIYLGMDQSETDTDSETPMGHASIWVQTHTICYRPVPENDPCNYTRYQRYRLSKRFMFD